VRLLFYINVMNVEKVYNKIRYTLSNDNLKKGDEVFPIASGRCTDDGGWILHDIEFDSEYVKGLNTSGFPDKPHIIENLKYSDYKPYEVKTNHGFSPKERYYKIIKREEQIKGTGPFSGSTWVEIKNV